MSAEGIDWEEVEAAEKAAEERATAATDLAVRIYQKKREHTDHGDGPGADVKVIEHPGYEPYVKLRCSVCAGESYVRRTP